MGREVRYVWVAVVLLLASGVRAQLSGVDEARAISREAQELAAQKQWDKAAEVLGKGLDRFRDGTEQSRNSRGLLHFSFGYLFQRWSQEQPQRRNELLGAALRSYGRARDELPGNSKVIDNQVVVLKQLGQWLEAGAVLELAAEADAEQRGDYLAAAGELYFEHGRFPEALRSYKGASQANPWQEGLYRRVISAYGRLGLARAEELLDYSRQLKEAGRGGVAKGGFEQVIRSCYAQEVPLAEEALLDWAEVGASDGWISQECVGLLPDANHWDSAAVKELRVLVMDPLAGLSGLDWWRARPRRRHVVASVARVLGGRLSVKGDVKGAVAVYEAALRVAPAAVEYQEPVLAGRPIVALDMHSDLAGICLRHSQEIDPDGRRLRSTIVDLFLGKREAYKARSLAAIQRYHTILGMIYAEKGQWTSGPDRRAENATFQLENAIAVAADRTKADANEYRPLPHLEGLLAKGYAGQGRRKDAHSNYVAAAMGYLDLDDLNRADEMLANALPLSAAVGLPERRRLEAVRGIAGSRRAIKALAKGDFDPALPRYFGRSEAYTWLSPSADSALDRSFLNRQRFKTLADLGRRASEVRAPGEALVLQVRALEAVKGERVLTGMGDVLRLERMGQKVPENVVLNRSKQRIGMGQDLEKNRNYRDGKVWRIPSGYQGSAVQVGISGDLILAGEIASQLSRVGGLGAADIEVRVQDGRATIVQQRPDEGAIKRSTAALKLIKGVREVRVAEPR